MKHIQPLTKKINLVMLLILIPGFSYYAAGQEMFVIPLDDEVYLYHTKQLTTGHGFNVYRRDHAGGDFILLTDDPVKGFERIDELRPALGESYEDVLRYFEVESTGALRMAIRTKPVENLIATALFPAFAKATGRVYIDDTAPMNQEVVYRIEFVNASGIPTGKTLTQSALLRAAELPVPEITGADNQGRQVRIEWHYPRHSDNNPNFVIQFLAFRISQVTGEPEFLTNDVIVRNNVSDSHVFVFESPVINTVEQYQLVAVDFTGRHSEMSELYLFELVDNIPPARINNFSSVITPEQWVDLRWDSHIDPGIIGYKIYRGTNLSVPLDLLTPEPLDAALTFYSDTTVKGGETYFYTITAVNSVGVEGHESEPVMARLLDLKPPNPPKMLSAAYNTETGHVELKWEVDSYTENFESFIIMRRREDTATPAAFSRINQGHLKETFFNDRGEGSQGFIEGGIYRYDVFSSSRAKVFSDTASLTFNIPVVTPPTAPGGLKAINDKGNRVILSWWAASSRNLTQYRVYRKVPGEAEFTALKDLPLETRFYRDEQINHGNTYVYAVSAIDIAGNEGPLSVPDTVFFRNFTPPRMVRNIQAKVIDGGVKITWGEVVADDFAGYAVYRSDIPTGRFIPIHEGLIEDTSFFDDDGTGSHWYRVKAKDTSGNESRPGNPVSPL